MHVQLNNYAVEIVLNTVCIIVEKTKAFQHLESKQTFYFFPVITPSHFLSHALTSFPETSPDGV
jgi:hypothetical protein